MDILTMEDDFDFLDDNDRRKEARRVVKDRREMVRYEVNKSDRRSGIERRKVKAPLDKRNRVKPDEKEVYEEERSNSVIAKIGSFFKR